MNTIDFKKTFDNMPCQYTKTFIAKTLGRSYATILNWYKGSKIPKDAHNRLLDFFDKNDVKIFFIS